MTTVAQMIEWLKTLPQDAEVQCGVEKTSSHTTYIKMVPVDIECCCVFDYTDEEYDAYPHIAGKILVQIHGE